MIDTWNPAKINEKISGRDSWNPAILNEAVTDRDSWNPAILNESAGETPVVFSATITASFPEGATCTATDGTTTLTADDNPMAFNIPNEGTWTVACVANGVTLSEDVVITTSGQTETIDLTPVGATVTPTDSVPVLIACAGIGDSEITTIAGALADVETLTSIIESENAIDYLVRSTTFASDVTADSSAMTYIGLNNYASDTLLADSTWLNAIVNSAYMTSVLNYTSPNMTSNTAPSGVCSASSNYDSSQAYLAFDGDPSTLWIANGATGWVRYQAAISVKAKVVIVRNLQYAGGINWRSKDFKINTSNDGISWTEQATGTLGDNDTPVKTIINVNTEYFEVAVTSNYGHTSQTSLADVKIYGRVDVE